MDVVVTDRKGEPVLDLRREDFTVSEDGVAQEVVAFDAVQPAGAAARPPAPRRGRASRARPRTASPLARAASHFVIVFDELHLTVRRGRARPQGGRRVPRERRRGRRPRRPRRHGARARARPRGCPRAATRSRRRSSRLQPRLVNETVRDRMSDYEAMRIDRDRDPHRDRRRDAALPRHGRDPAGHRVAGQRGDPQTRTRSGAGATRCSPGPPASTRARPPATSRRSASSSARSRRSPPSAGASRSSSRPAASSRTRASPSTARS